MYQEIVKDKCPIDLKIGPGKYGYYQVIEQWNAMLCDSETIEWGTPIILKLLDFVDGLENKDDTLQIYNTTEWHEIVTRRGPAEAAWKAQCSNCGLVNIGFGTSGFVDEYYTVDYSSQQVVWQSVYPDGPPVRDNSLCSKCNTLLPEKSWVSVYKALRGFTVLRK